MKTTKMIIGAVTGFAVATFFISCDTNSERMENAEKDLQDAQKELKEEQAEYAHEWEEFKADCEEKIAKNEAKIDDLKTKAKKTDNPDKSKRLSERVAELEQKNDEIKQRLYAYSDQGKERWESFKREFGHDMDEIGNSLNDLTKDNVE